MAIDHTLKQALYEAADKAHSLARKAAREAARGNTAVADDLLYQATVTLDGARDGVA